VLFCVCWAARPRGPVDDEWVCTEMRKTERTCATRTAVAAFAIFWFAIFEGTCWMLGEVTFEYDQQSSSATTSERRPESIGARVCERKFILQ